MRQQAHQRQGICGARSSGAWGFAGRRAKGRHPVVPAIYADGTGGLQAIRPRFGPALHIPVREVPALRVSHEVDELVGTHVHQCPVVARFEVDIRMR